VTSNRPRAGSPSSWPSTSRGLAGRHGLTAASSLKIGPAGRGHVATSPQVVAARSRSAGLVLFLVLFLFYLCCIFFFCFTPPADGAVSSAREEELHVELPDVTSTGTDRARSVAGRPRRRGGAGIGGSPERSTSLEPASRWLQAAKSGLVEHESCAGTWCGCPGSAYCSAEQAMRWRRPHAE